MLTRNVFLLLSLFVLMVRGDLDSNDAGIQTMSTDKDSTSDEAPTDTSSSSSEVADAPAANQVTAPVSERAAAAANSVEEQDDNESTDSEEGGKKKFSSRSSKPHQRPAHIQRDPPQLIQRSFISAPSPALHPQPIIPQSKTLRSRLSKRRSRTSRHQI
ncbi:hypothetical protein Q5P01_018920 [Channa striata]|uniref:Uncharacterized protein n=1 Tax=Channa striata TaxID=64152 RepID=A0AA88M5S2_CHASR|nr:hypothetical protein Q5P01_018920 [Channa striata]